MFLLKAPLLEPKTKLHCPQNANWNRKGFASLSKDIKGNSCYHSNLDLLPRDFFLEHLFQQHVDGKGI